jgi:hypothetical protein
VKDWSVWVKWMEVVGVVFIAPSHFLAVAPFLPTADGPRPWSGRSAPTHQRLKSQRSAVTAISTAIYALNASSDVRYGSHGRSGSAPRTVRGDAYNSFYRTRHLRVFLVFTDRTVRAWGRTVRAWGQTVRAWSRTMLASLSDGLQCRLVFLQCSCPRVTLVPRTVRRKGPDGPRLGVFPKKLLLSRQST